MSASSGVHWVIHTHTHTETRTHTHTRATQNWELEDTDQRKEKKGNLGIEKNNPTGFLNICGLEFHSAEMGRESTLQNADPRVLPDCFQCLLAGWLGPRHSRLGTFIKARMQRRQRTRRWALCMYEAFSVDVGHARRCTQEDYLILIHATWYNVIKHLTWEISSILIWERTGGN